MHRMEVGRALEAAFRHMTDLLFRPFAARLWFALGFVFIVANLGGSQSSFNIPSGGEQPSGSMSPDMREILTWVQQFWWVVALGLLVLTILALLIVWLSSIFQFIYLNGIVRKSAAIQEPFSRLKGLGTSYFLFRLVVGIAVMILLLIFAGLPVAISFLPQFEAIVWVKVVAIAWGVLLLVAILVAAGLLDLLLKDFVVAVMYARNVRVMEAWRMATPVLRANVGQVLLYILVLIPIAIAIGLVSMLAVLALLVIVAIPIAILAIIIFAGIEVVSIQWTIALITSAVAVGLVLLLGITYVVATAMQPAYVFRRAFPLALLGQADPSLATIPIERAPSS